MFLFLLVFLVLFILKIQMTWDVSIIDNTNGIYEFALVIWSKFEKVLMTIDSRLCEIMLMVLLLLFFKLARHSCVQIVVCMMELRFLTVTPSDRDIWRRELENTLMVVILYIWMFWWGAWFRWVCIFSIRESNSVKSLEVIIEFLITCLSSRLYEFNSVSNG